MKKILCFLIFVLGVMSFKANAWCPSVNNSNNGMRFFSTAPIKLGHGKGEVLVETCIAQDYSKGDWKYILFFFLPEDESLAWETPENAPKNHRGGPVMKVRNGAGEEVDLAPAAAQNFTCRSTKMANGADKIVMCFDVTKEEFYKIVDNGLKDISIETNTPGRYVDYYFTDKQTKSSAKDFKKAVKKLLKTIDRMSEK